MRKLGTKLILAVLLLGASPPWLWGELGVGRVDGDTPNVEVLFTSPVDSSYSLSAAPQNGWIFTKDFSYPNSNGWYKSGDYGISNELTSVLDVVAFVDAASIFSATISGKMYKPGGNGGSPIDWSVTGMTLRNSVNPVVLPSRKLLPAADRSFSYISITPFQILPGAVWKYSGTTVSGDSVSVFRELGGMIYTFPADAAAGTYTLTGSRNSRGDKSSSAEVIVVEVQKVSATAGETTIESITASPGDAETIYVKKKANTTLTITATPQPGNEWPEGYPTWSGGEGGVVSADGTSYTVKTSTTGEYIISASCGNTKKIKLIVYNLEALNVDASTPTSSKINYKLEPATLELTGKFKVGASLKSTKEVSGEFSFTFDQNAILSDTIFSLTASNDKITEEVFVVVVPTAKFGSKSSIFVGYILIEGVGVRAFPFWGNIFYTSYSYSVASNGKLLKFKKEGGWDKYTVMMYCTYPVGPEEPTYTIGFNYKYLDKTIGVADRIGTTILPPNTLSAGADFSDNTEKDISANFVLVVSGAIPPQWTISEILD